MENQVLEPFFRAEEREGERRINVLRAAALALLYLNELLNFYMFGVVDARFHRLVTLATGLYGLCAAGQWWLINVRGFYRRQVKYAAMLADALFLTFVLGLANGPSSPLVPVYYLLIAVSALRYNRGATFTGAAFCAAAFLALEFQARLYRPELAVPMHVAVIQVLCMLMMGVASGYVVFQLRALVHKFAAAIKRQEKTEGALASYVSQQVADQIMKKDGSLLFEGQRRDATVLMCDIRGFTPMAEKMDPVELMSLLNRYFAAMIKVIFLHDGTLDKFIGDAVMVVFGAPLPQADMVERAVRCAVDMQKALSVFNEEQRAAGAPVLGAGITVHCGPVVAGTVGSEMRMEYTVLGDVVNLTQRMQSRTPAGKIIVSGAVYDRVSDKFRFSKMEPFSVKGRLEPVQAYEFSGPSA